MSPTKLELLTVWLPGQSWYRGTGQPELAKAGGFRLDDPAGEVGIEIAVVADADGIRYLVPMTYRGAPLDGADAALIGTSEHGVLGTRWIYDAEQDPVALAQLAALLAGRAVVQHQDLSDTVDATVVAEPLLTDPAALDAGDVVLHLVRVPGVRVPGEGADSDGDVVAAVTMDLPGVGRRAVVQAVRRRA